jgi:tetratricopeptide (TPR) repeat protein
VLLGRCTEAEGAPPYLPFIEALESFLGEQPTEVLRERLGEDAPIVAKLLPQITARLPDLPPPPELPAESERYMLFQAVAALLRGIAEESGLLLVLEDLHWADKPSLLLLQHLARQLQGSRLLVLGLYRDVEVDSKHPLFEVLADLGRDRLFERISLSGLPVEEVRTLLTTVSEQEAPEAFARALYQQTEGNPFFVEETLRHLVQEGVIYRSDAGWTSDLTVSEMRLPEGVKEAIVHRLARLSDACHSLLREAAVLGREFRHGLLAHLTGKNEEELLDLVEEALSSVVLEEAPGRQLAYSFTHALTRQTLLEESSRVRRQRLHLRAADAIQAAYASTLEEHAAELAYHLSEAGELADPDRTVRFLSLAADQALRSVAYEEGAHLCEMALQALDLTQKLDEALRCELLLALGEAKTRAGDPLEGAQACLRAATIAKELGDAELLARTALVLDDSNFFTGGTAVAPETVASILEEALNALGERDSKLRALVLARLPRTLSFSALAPVERRVELAREAVKVAERVGDIAVRAAALHAMVWALGGPDDVHRQLAIATEIMELAKQAGDEAATWSVVAWGSHIRRVTAFAQLGDMGAVDREIEAIAGLPEELRQPVALWYPPMYRAMRALFDGRFEEGERLALQALAAGQRAQQGFATANFATQVFQLRREQGRLHELEAVVRGMVERDPGVPAWRCALAFIYAELGREAEARHEFEILADEGFAVPRDLQWMTGMSALAEVCAYLGDAPRAETLYHLMLPYAHLNVVVGLATSCLGSASRYLGLLATTMELWDEAARHFEDALEMNAKMGARPSVAWTQHNYGRMLLTRGDPGDRDKAQDLLQEALDTAQELGMKVLAERAEGLLGQTGSAA